MLAIICKFDKTKGPLLFVENIENIFHLPTYESDDKLTDESKDLFRDILLEKLLPPSSGKNDELSEIRTDIIKLFKEAKLDEINDDNFTVSCVLKIILPIKYTELLKPLNEKYSWIEPSKLDDTDSENIKMWSAKYLGVKAEKANPVEALTKMFKTEIKKEDEYVELQGSFKLKGNVEISIGITSTIITSGILKFRLKGAYTIKTIHGDKETVTEITQNISK